MKLQEKIVGLKQTSKQWYLKFDRFIVSGGYSGLQIVHCCYFKYFENSYIILLLYVDDMLVTGANMKEIVNLKAS